MQREIGFESALLMLKARGVDLNLARTVLQPYLDRRVSERRDWSTRGT